MKLILGSQSKTRQEALKRAGIKFEVITADIDEKAIRSDDYEELPLLIARAKADVLTNRVEEPALLVTADTVTVFGGMLREKPETKEEAREFLESYVEHEPIQVITGMTVTNTVTGKRAEGIATATRTLSKLPQELVDELVDDPVTFTYAGGFTIYDERYTEYLDIDESSTDNVAGMPLGLLRQLIAEVTT